MPFTFGTSFRLWLPLPARAVPLRMAWIPPGSFMMGSLPSESGLGVTHAAAPFHATLSQGFWLGRYLVTQAHWHAVMGNNPSYFFTHGMNRPVERVSWHDALAFCQHLNQHFAGHLPDNYRFGLPTELQWEYACRAGTHMWYHNGSTATDLARIAWYKDNSAGETNSVGQKEPNAWGLYDMLGNVCEWCYDSPSDHPYYTASDWVGTEPRESGLRAFRSCFYDIGPGACRISAREWVSDDLRISWQGFRLCLRPSIADEVTHPHRPQVRYSFTSDTAYTRFLGADGWQVAAPFRLSVFTSLDDFLPSPTTAFFGIYLPWVDDVVLEAQAGAVVKASGQALTPAEGYLHHGGHSALRLRLEEQGDMRAGEPRWWQVRAFTLHYPTHGHSAVSWVSRGINGHNFFSRDNRLPPHLRQLVLDAIQRIFGGVVTSVDPEPL